jgi:hypothetical protein
MNKKGTFENPYETMQEAIDACDGTGKMIFVFNKNSELVFWSEGTLPEAAWKPHNKRLHLTALCGFLHRLLTKVGGR